MIKAHFNVLADMSGMDKFVKECLKLEGYEVDTGFGEENAFLSSLNIRVIWTGSGDSAEGDHSFLPTQPLCSR